MNDIPLAIRLISIFTAGGIMGCLLDEWARRLALPYRLEPKKHTPFRRVFVGLLFGFILAAVYHWEIVQRGITLPNLLPEADATLYARYLVHVVLCSLLLVATLIDFDEMMIPDSITIPGTLIGLFAASLFPNTLLPVREFIGFDDIGFEKYANLAIPIGWNSPRIAETVFSFPFVFGVWSFWCFAMLNRVWYGKLGIKRAALLFVRRLRRSPSTKWLLGLWIFGLISISMFWSFTGEHSPHWNGLLTAMSGLFGGAIVVWGVRLIGSVALQREAMGFGDVTLMAMIGTFIGWQGSVLIFFLAPFSGIFFILGRAALRSGNELPFGPFLCLATLITIVAWPFFWLKMETLLLIGPILPVGGMVVCLVLLGLMLYGWKLYSNTPIN